MSGPVARRGYAWLTAVLGVLFLLCSLRSWADSLPPTIAIIIDDMGNTGRLGEELLHMKYPLTFSFLPFRPYTRQQAIEAHYLHKGVMLHMPMANMHHLPLGAAGLRPDMDKPTIETLVRRSLEDIPYVQGINNHEGSLLTQLRRPMGWVMDEVQKYPLYFVDSRTIASSVAAQVAQQHHIPNLSRDVFLDDELNSTAINRQFQRLIAIAKATGSAVAIGHPHPETVSFLLTHMQELDRQGIAVATVSGLWRLRHPAQRMFAGQHKQPIMTRLASWQQVSRAVRRLP